MDEWSMYYDLINQQQQANNAWSAEQAQKAMDYQTQMSNTAHQREVADLKAAGLNPVLSAGGQGATTGTGHAAQAGNENVQALYGMVSKLMDVQLEQAAALKTSAASVGGYTGSSDSGKGTSAVSVGNKGIFDLAEFLGLTKDQILQMVGRFLHIDKKTLGLLVDTFGDDPTKWPMLPGKDNRNNKQKQESQMLLDKAWERVLHTKPEPETTSEKKSNKTNDPLPKREPYKPSKKQKQEAAVAVGLAIAALIGKGVAGGSAKREVDKLLEAYEY